MPDYEIHANTDADMQNAFAVLSMTQRDGFRVGIRYSINYYGVKTVGGIAQPGVYAICRYDPDNPGAVFPGGGLTLPPGLTVIKGLPANTPVTFFG
jgi:hypothetical protein